MSKYLSAGLKLFAAALLLVSPAVLHADGITENFDEANTGLDAWTAGNFAIVAGQVDVVGGALFGNLCAAPASGNCVDLDGSDSGVAGALSSGPLTLDAGTYELSFDLLGSQRGVNTSTTVTLGSLYNETFLLDSGDLTGGIVSTIIDVPTTTTVPLIFASNTPGYVGAVLDNVSLTPVTNTPEPGTFALMAVGLLGLALRRRTTGARSEV